jgi:hypothetical protein
VLSVPPHFDAVQRSVLSDAAATATTTAAASGWLVAGTIDEPVAAVAAALDTGALPAEVRCYTCIHTMQLLLAVCVSSTVLGIAASTALLLLFTICQSQLLFTSYRLCSLRIWRLNDAYTLHYTR